MMLEENSCIGRPDFDDRYQATDTVIEGAERSIPSL